LPNRRIVNFDRRRITKSIFKRVRRWDVANELSSEVIRIIKQKHRGNTITKEDIRNTIQIVLADHPPARPPYRHPPRRHGIRIPNSVKVSILVLLILLVEFFAIRSLFDPTIYVLAAAIAGFLDWKIFQVVARIPVHTDARLFGLRLLSIIIIIAGWAAGMVWFASFINPLWSFMLVIWPFILMLPYPNLILPNNPFFFGGTVFVFVFAIGLFLVGAFLEFRFMRGAGVIIFPR
jgi:hypothetical protein